MKAKALQFGKAMSAALFVLLLVAVATENALAQNQVATLQHNDSITGVFYGQNAYSSAYNAAVNGDVITLSSGTFNAINIEKAITVRGAGCVYDSLTQLFPTIVLGNFNISKNNISFEGIWFTGTISSIATYISFGADVHNDNISFTKCNISEIGSSNTSMIRMNWQFANCIFTFNPSAYFHGMSIINSVVRVMHYQHSDMSNLTTFNNTVALFDEEQAINNIVSNNSIIATVSGHSVTNCSFFNCIGIETGETALFDGQIAQNVMEVDSYEDVFETFDGTISYDNIYQLKNDIATSFLGHDGTEVGIYGGMMPYDPRPTYMKIKHCNVAPRSTIDNKLSVDIEVLTGDE